MSSGSKYIQTYTLYTGEFVSVVGPSGSRKSTLLNMLGALDRPTSGKVFIDGIDIFSLNDTQLATVRNNKLGFIFQSYNLINRTTVLKNVEFPGIIGGMSDADRRHRAIKLLDFLGIKNILALRTFIVAIFISLYYHEEQYPTRRSKQISSHV